MMPSGHLENPDVSYLLLIIEPVGQRATRTEAEGRAAYAAMQAFGETLAAAGQLAAVESLSDLQGAARVQQVDGRTRVIDGPFAEAKEMVGGFFLLPTVGRGLALAVLCALSCCVLAAAFARPAVLAALDLPYALRVALLVVALAPVSLALGMPFPLGLDRFQRSGPAMLPEPDCPDGDRGTGGNRNDLASRRGSP